LSSYVIWRDVIWEKAWTILPAPRRSVSIRLVPWDPPWYFQTPQRYKFLYALWRDVVWDKAWFGTAWLVEFLYALWRDVIWDWPLPSEASETCHSFYTPCGVTLFETSAVRRCGSMQVPQFLYALWRDVVWDNSESTSIGDKCRFYTPCGVTLFGTGTSRFLSACSACFYTPCGVTLFGTLPCLTGP